MNAGACVCINISSIHRPRISHIYLRILMKKVAVNVQILYTVLFSSVTVSPFHMLRLSSLKAICFGSVQLHCRRIKCSDSTTVATDLNNIWSYTVWTSFTDSLGHYSESSIPGCYTSPFTTIYMSKSPLTVEPRCLEPTDLFRAVITVHVCIFAGVVVLATINTIASLILLFSPTFSNPKFYFAFLFFNSKQRSFNTLLE